MIRRKILIALFGIGTVAGFGSGISSMRHHCRAHHDAWERHVAHVCAEAAKHPEQAPATDPYNDW